MNPSQRKQLKEVRKRMIDLDLTSRSLAVELNTSITIISQLVNGHNYYPRYAKQLRERYGIVIPDTRVLRRSIARAA